MAILTIPVRTKAGAAKILSQRNDDTKVELLLPEYDQEVAQMWLKKVEKDLSRTLPTVALVGYKEAISRASTIDARALYIIDLTGKDRLEIEGCFVGFQKALESANESPADKFPSAAESARTYFEAWNRTHDKYKGG